jgi:hypothetical protein
VFNFKYLQNKFCFVEFDSTQSKTKMSASRQDVQIGVNQMYHQMMNNDPEWSQLLEMTAEQQAEYADHICKQHATNKEFLRNQIVQSRNNSNADEDFAGWNRTSLANIAYLAIHAPNPFRGYYVALRTKFIAWKRQNPDANRDDGCQLM